MSAMKEFLKLSVMVALGLIWGIGSYHFSVFPVNELKLIKSKLTQGSSQSSSEDANLEHHEWAKKLQNGGYILHIRHAMREKWDDVTAYDAIELYDKDDARARSYYRAVCLTEKGIEDSKLIGKAFDLVGVKVGPVISSPSCRSRETAIYAFGKIDQIEPSVLHRTAQMPQQHKEMGNKLRQVLDDTAIPEGENVIISGHGATLRVDFKNGVGIVDVNQVDRLDDRLETGITVIERQENGKYIARHQFESIHDFVNNILELPAEDNSAGRFLFGEKDVYNPKNIKSGYIYNHKNND